MHSEETRARMSAAHKGKRFTEEHRKAMSQSARNRKKTSISPALLELIEYLIEEGKK